MGKYIDKEAMLEQIARRESLMVGDKMISIDALREFIMNRPVVDVEHVIRCKHCGCVFEVDATDYGSHMGGPFSPDYAAFCPTCHKWCFSKGTKKGKKQWRSK